MKVRVPLMIMDPAGSQLGIDRLVEDWTGIEEDHYLDGPVTPRVAVVDLDPDTERNVPGATFRPPAGDRKLGAYAVDRKDFYSPNFIQVNAFGSVLRTMYMFEEPDTLGRKVDWGFDAPQLLVVPRAGWWANAFYERRSHSLQFFSFRPEGGAGDRVVHTSLSRDIVAHETAHSLIDGIARDLYDALDPQSLALHEGLADLTAVLIAFRSHTLCEAVLDKTGGSIEHSKAFSSIGDEFGDALNQSGHPLRDLLNDSTLPPDPADEPEEHELSLVLSGALYDFMCHLHAGARQRLAEETGKSELEVSGKALFEASERFKRLILRGLDYLTPGEVAFIDYARAILAADQASHPADEDRAHLIEELVRRGIARSPAELEVQTDFPSPAVAAADLQGLVDSDWVAYTFADKNRDLLSIPNYAEFEVLPRRVVTKQYYLDDYRRTKRTTPVTELLFKVRWSETEENPPELGAATRRIQTGTTLVIDWDKKVVRACLKPWDLKGRAPARTAMLRRLMTNGLVSFTSPAGAEAKSQPFGSGIDAVVTDGILRVHNTARLLHIARSVDDD
jgi:hypothetical protein